MSTRADIRPVLQHTVSGPGRCCIVASSLDQALHQLPHSCNHACATAHPGFRPMVCHGDMVRLGCSMAEGSSAEPCLLQLVSGLCFSRTRQAPGEAALWAEIQTDLQSEFPQSCGQAYATAPSASGPWWAASKPPSDHTAQELCWECPRMFAYPASS